ncbi:AAA family ATPase [Microbacterium sp. TS-1]
MLYGPPGTGKTLTICHLASRATDATVSRCCSKCSKRSTGLRATRTSRS